ncbi:hypothetical protein [Bordetella flabilis]|uniref:Uncharacterized protein n=1 Tax=Bordetella flabilis TaxID=463014 RepID=A0A193GAJ8_9BORD|nr:hypothetical protein [Bordetella flabilis]ANN76491.1 hypothetical protein BAU07_04610 [Bordetella flabilis]
MTTITGTSGVQIIGRQQGVPEKPHSAPANDVADALALISDVCANKHPNETKEKHKCERSLSIQLDSPLPLPREIVELGFHDDPQDVSSLPALQSMNDPEQASE